MYKKITQFLRPLSGVFKMLPGMKLTSLFILSGLLQICTAAHAQSVTYADKNVSLDKLFKEIEKQTPYHVLWSFKTIKDAPAFQADFKSTPVKDALDKAFRGSNLKYVIDGQTILIQKNDGSKPPVPANADPGSVRGVVRDGKGKPIASVTAMAKHAHLLTITDDEGGYAFPDLEPNDTLLFSSVGYDPVTIAATAGFKTIVMNERVTTLNNVTIVYNTGYQMLNPERATGSFAKPDMKIFHDRVGTQDVITRLEGQIAGLALPVGNDGTGVIVNTNGPASGKATVRGLATASGSTSQPLMVLNGVIVPDFNSINTNDIEDITVLKDAAAAAIWGAQATNGVIVVVTKSGKRNQRLTVNYDASLNYQGKPDFSYQRMMNSRQYMQAARETFDPQTYPYQSLTYSTIAPHEQILYDAYLGKITSAQANAKLDSLGSINNWKQISDLLYANAFNTNHSLSVSGGSGAYTFYAALGYTGSQSNTPGTHNNTYRINVSQNVNLGSRVHVGLNTSMVNNVSNGGHPISASHSALPYQLLRDNQGNNLNANYMYGVSDSLRLDYAARSRISTDYNPLNERGLGYSKNNGINLNTTANVGIKLFKGLSFEGTYGYLRSEGTASSYIDNQALSMRKLLISFTKAPTVNDVPVYYLPIAGGDYTSTNVAQTNWTVRNQLVYTATPRNGMDNLTLQAGQEAIENSSTSSVTNLFGFNDQLGTAPVLDYKTLNQGIPGTITGYGFTYLQPYQERKTLSRYSSYFALGSYTFNGKYNLDVSWRRDHSNLFGSDVSAQNKPTWSMGGRWELSKEKFMGAAKWVNDLGLRATYGITGNSPFLGTSATNDVLYAVQAVYSGSIAGDALEIATPANRLVTWERTQTTNIAIDFAVLDRRLSGTFEVYNRYTSGLLSTVPVNPFTGFTFLAGNLGNYNNHGLEITLRTENIRGPHFSWSTSLVFAYNRNMLKSLGIPQDYQQEVSYRIGATNLAGYSSQPIFAYRYAGLDNAGDPQIYLKDKSVTKTPNVATKDDIVYKGSAVPPVNGGFTNTFHYDAFSLSANMIYNLGNVMRRPVNQFYAGMLGTNSDFSGNNYAPSFLDRWKQPGDEKKTSIPSYVADYYTAYTRRDVTYYTNADLNVVSASYIKLRDVTLGYELPPGLVKTLKLQRMNVYAQATNFMVWKANHEGVDPEYQSLGYGDWGVKPIRHAWNFGVNVSF